LVIDARRVKVNKPDYEKCPFLLAAALPANPTASEAEVIMPNMFAH
jgi:hypothetical protein